MNETVSLPDAHRFSHDAMNTTFWLRIIVTYLVPIAIATTLPVQGLRGELPGLQVLAILAFSLAFFYLAARIWRSGVRRYSGASS